ncbi:MAG: hypothetical protein ACRYFZ_09595 [Janthinobacterium lividum]
MSSKSTIFSLNGLEHWHEECIDPRDTVGIEFNASSIEEVDTSDGMTVWVKADSQLGRLLRNAEVRAVLNRVAEEQNAEQAAYWVAKLP